MAKLSVRSALWRAVCAVAALVLVITVALLCCDAYSSIAAAHGAGIAGTYECTDEARTPLETVAVGRFTTADGEVIDNALLSTGTPGRGAVVGARFVPTPVEQLFGPIVRTGDLHDAGKMIGFAVALVPGIVLTTRRAMGKGPSRPADDRCHGTRPSSCGRRLT